MYFVEQKYFNQECIEISLLTEAEADERGYKCKMCENRCGYDLYVDVFSTEERARKFYHTCTEVGAAITGGGAK